MCPYIHTSQVMIDGMTRARASQATSRAHIAWSQMLGPDMTEMSSFSGQRSIRVATLGEMHFFEGLSQTKQTRTHAIKAQIIPYRGNNNYQETCSFQGSESRVHNRHIRSPRRYYGEYQETNMLRVACSRSLSWCLYFGSWAKGLQDFFFTKRTNEPNGIPVTFTHIHHLSTMQMLPSPSPHTYILFHFSMQYIYAQYITCIPCMTYIYVYMHACIHTQKTHNIHTYIHPSILTYMHTHIHTCMHTYTKNT